MSANLTMRDGFCGAGGSSTGATMVPGVRVVMALNHWKLAIETHNANHPETDHDCADISQVDPRRYVKVDIAWWSPECTNHSIAKGRRRNTDGIPDLFGDTLPDEAAQRSRATMWDVVRFAECHRERAIIVENVVDAAEWPLWTAWLTAMTMLGYEHRVVYANSMHAQAGGHGAPQSRDRMYVVFWRKGDRRPDFDKWTRPSVVCPTCGPVKAVQAWKNPDRHWGRYRAQYAWRCPKVACRNRIIEPDVLPASSAIDWALKGRRIGDRAKPLAEKTLSRIRIGLERYQRPALVPVEGREGKMAAAVDQPLRTMTTRNETALLVPPFIAELRGGSSDARPVSHPMATVTASGNHHALTVHGDWESWAAVYSYANRSVRPVTLPLPTQTTVVGEGVLTGTGVLNADDCWLRMLEPYEASRGMAFPPSYVMLGNKREQMRLAGNAVCPPNARDLVAMVTEALTGETVELGSLAAVA